MKNTHQLKPSRYNFIFKNDGSIYIYNAFLNSLAKINNSTALFLRSAEIFHEKQLQSEIKAKLEHGGFIVDEEMDELAELKVRNRLVRFGNTSFGITIAPTLACNFKCSYCFQRHSQEKMTNETAENVYNFVIRNLKNKSSFGVCWYGGEPLLAVDVIEYLSKRFITLCDTMNIAYHADISSNGYLMNEKTAVLLSELNVNFWQVTLDGPPDVHNKRRALANGEPSFDTVLNNVIRCHEYFNRVSIRINVDKNNQEYVPMLLDTLDDAGLKNKVDIYFGKVEALGICKDIGSICYLDKEFADIEPRLYDIALQKAFILKRRPQLLSAYCTADRTNSFVIDPEGTLMKCWKSVGVEEERIGSVTDDKLNHNYVKWLSYDPFEDPECVKCKLLPICMGGCPYSAVLSSKKSCREIKYNLDAILKLRIKELAEEGAKRDDR